MTQISVQSPSTTAEKWGLDTINDNNNKKNMIKKPHAVSLWYLCVFVSSCWCLTWMRQCLFRRCNLSRLGISCHKRGITQGVTHVTFCLCFYPPSFSSSSRAPLFMSRSRPLFFWLNNWLEARPAEGEKQVWLDKKRMRKLGDILASDLALSRQRWWLKHSFPRFSSDSPLTRQSGSFPPECQSLLLLH